PSPPPRLPSTTLFRSRLDAREAEGTRIRRRRRSGGLAPCQRQRRTANTRARRRHRTTDRPRLRLHRPAAIPVTAAARNASEQSDSGGQHPRIPPLHTFLPVTGLHDDVYSPQRPVIRRSCRENEHLGISMTL